MPNWGDTMAHFGKLYLDKEKDIVVYLDMAGDAMEYTIAAHNHRSDNLIENFAKVCGQTTCLKNGTISSVIWRIHCS